AVTPQGDGGGADRVRLGAHRAALEAREVEAPVVAVARGVDRRVGPQHRARDCLSVLREEFGEGGHGRTAPPAAPVSITSTAPERRSSNATDVRITSRSISTSGSAEWT